MKKSNVISYIVVIIFALLIMGEVLRMHYFSSKMLPLILSSLLLVMAAIGLVREFLAKNKKRIDDTLGSNTTESKDSWLKIGLVGVWLIGFFIMIYLVGFLITIPILITSYLKTHGAGWRMSIIYSALTTILLYVVFTLILQLSLYKGLLFS